MIGNYLCALSEILDIYSSGYNDFITPGDFKIEIKEQQVKTFCDNYGLCAGGMIVKFSFYDSKSYKKDFQEIKT